MAANPHTEGLHAQARANLMVFVTQAREWLARAESEGRDQLAITSFALGTHLTAVLDPERAIALLVVACIELAQTSDGRAPWD